ncbi:MULTISPECIES: hypothetical protein [Methylobacterium]|uniref:hypothetical protein n=1 Tax=Methylobacterium TaxID=407 RepID=UPI0013ED52E0|nr:hypothetical protein [Methylobacterium sp. DB0501]NGM36040.1 hypothetical protein [Methylobacterium sp. DB0501]
MALDRGHLIRIRTRIAHVADGATQGLGKGARTGTPARTLDADGAVPAAPFARRRPAVVEAQVGRSSA